MSEGCETHETGERVRGISMDVASSDMVIPFWIAPEKCYRSLRSADSLQPFADQ